MSDRAAMDAMPQSFARPSRARGVSAMSRKGYDIDNAHGICADTRCEALRPDRGGDRSSGVVDGPCIAEGATPRGTTGRTGVRRDTGSQYGSEERCAHVNAG
jgi:hypothetical protein